MKPASTNITGQQMNTQGQPSPLRIVHLEDMPEDAELVQRTLRKAGVVNVMLHIDNKDAFVHALKEFRPDIIISDHSLPSFNSHEALQILRETGATIPFILVTATVSEEYAVTIIKEGASDYILKDRLQRLPSAIQSALEKAATEKELALQRVLQQKLITETSIQVQEHERNEIGKELHDNINQVLATAKLYLHTAIKKQGHSTELLDKTQECIVYAIEEIRKLSHSLVAPSLGKMTLPDAIRELIEDIERTTSLRIELSASDFSGEGIDEDMSLMFYRIVQEQINNILKHAGAKHAKIEFSLAGNHIRLAVSDDGAGFDKEKAKGGIGLKNISNRVGFYDGESKIISEPGQGCTLEVLVPL